MPQRGTLINGDDGLQSSVDERSFAGRVKHAAFESRAACFTRSVSRPSAIFRGTCLPFWQSRRIDRAGPPSRRTKGPRTSLVLIATDRAVC